MTSSSPIGLEGSDLSSINTMMSAVMSVGKAAENGGSPQSIKSPTKPPGPNRIGRRNQEMKEEKSSYNCPLCEKICTTQHQLTMHIRQHNTDTGGADHSCSICGKSLSSASSLDRHMLVHSGERPYKCTVCGQSFTTNGNMHRHMKIHEKDPNSAAAAAPPSPLKRRRLSSKRKLSHDAESEREDPAPAKKMAEDGQSGDLEKKADEVFHCPVCFKEFVCKYGLESHMETHSDNPLSMEAMSENKMVPSDFSTGPMEKTSKPLPFKDPNFVHSGHGGAVAGKKNRTWKNLKQILASERALPWQLNDPNYFSIDAPPSFKPAKKYSDVSGLLANYTDPQSKLRFSTVEEFSYIRRLPSDVVTGYLALRKATSIVP